MFVSCVSRANLYKLIKEASTIHEPIHITGKKVNAVLISEDDWRSVQETLYLLSMPGMRESETNLGRELAVVRPYLEILRVRMGELP